MFEQFNVWVIDKKAETWSSFSLNMSFIFIFLVYFIAILV